MSDRVRVECHVDGRPTVLVLTGRDGWALLQLVAAGEKGCTPIDQPAPRWSGYIHKIRKQGVRIVTIHEPHSASFSGTHARYVLRSSVEMLEPADG